MREPAEWQDGFARALIRPNLQVPSGLASPGGEPSEKRFSVYRNNVVRGLVEALKEMFPAVHRIVGEEFFECMARDYALQRPPRSPILLEYGSSFPDFVEQFEAAARLPYLSDVGRIERRWLEAYHAAEAESLNANDLDSFLRSDISELCVKLHPSIRFVRSRYPVLTIWSTNIAGAVPIPVDLDAGGEEVLITRIQSDVEVFLSSIGAMEFLAALSRHETILTASQLALEMDSYFSLASALQQLVAAGMIVDFGTYNEVVDDQP
jgi:hypothetical protein